MTDVLIKRDNFDTDLNTGRMLCEDEDRHWGDAPQAKERQRCQQTPRAEMTVFNRFSLTARRRN
jgi:hypothetical protein